MAINIADNSPRVNYTATSGQTVFTVSFEFFEDADLSVYINGTEKTITTHYTVSGGDGSTGTVTLTSGATAGDKVAIVRDVSLQRTSDFTEGAAISRAALNEQLDIITAQIADVDDKASRSLQLNDHEVAVSITLPATNDRKGKILGFNASTGAVEAGPTLADTQSLADVSADIATLADIEDGTDATDAIQTVAGISSNVSTVAGISANVTTVAGITSNIASVVADEADIGVVAGISSDVSTVSGISADVTTVAADGTDIGVVAGISSDVTTVSGISADVTTVSSISSNVTTVAGNSASITTVAGNSSNVTIVADNITDVNTVASNIGSITTKVSKSGDTMTGNLLFDDTSKVLLGTRSNLQIYHSATAITASNITLYFTNGSTSGTMEITDTDHTISVSDTVRVDSPEILESTPVTVAGVVLSSLQQDLTVSATTATTFTVPVTYASDPGTTGTLSQAGTYYYYTGSATSYISEQGAGSLHVLGSEINVYNSDETSQLAQFSTAATKLFHNNSEKLTTTATGISLPEDLTVQGNLTVQGTTITVDSASAQTVDLGDNDKIRLGDGDDLQIYHDGSNSFISDQGTGQLTLLGSNAIALNNAANTENMLVAFENGSIDLYYDNSKKLATTSTGIDVTGTVTADGVQSTDGDIKVTTSSSFVGFNSQRAGVPSAGGYQLGRLNFDAYSTGTTFVSGASIQSFSDGAAWTSTSTPTYLSFQTTPSGSTSLKERIKVANNGDISFYEDTGTTAKFFWDASAESLGIGTSSPSYALDIQDDDATRHLRVFRNASGTSAIMVQNADTGSGSNDGLQLSVLNGGDAQIANLENTNLRFLTNSSERMRIDSSGNVGIGATPEVVSGYTTIQAQGSSQGGIFTSTTSSGDKARFYVTTTAGYAGTVSNQDFIFLTNDTERMRIDSSGNVGIGVTDPVGRLEVKNSGDDNGFEFLPAYSSNINLMNSYNRNASTYYPLENRASYFMFKNGTSEAMRIDSSGNVLVGRTSTSDTNVGGMIRPDGFVQSTRDGNIAADFNRNTSDGDIVRFSKGSSPVGSIGSVIGARLSVNSQSTAGYLGIGGANYYSWNADDFRPQTDNLYDLGDAVARFDDVYATNGTIQTSDRNEKQDIAELTDAEQRVAVAAKGLLRKFRWKDAVAEKGDEARTHFGIIAQDLQAAFAAEGLDAGDYAMFIHTTWTDEETGEERSRMGVRYSELLAFIIAAI